MYLHPIFNKKSSYVFGMWSFSSMPFIKKPVHILNKSIKKKNSEECIERKNLSSDHIIPVSIIV